jgi:hygromycin-B 7''-O-kinase
MLLGSGIQIFSRPKHFLESLPLNVFLDVIKIFPPIHASIFESERLVLRHLSGKLSVKTPNLMCTGEIEGWPYMIMERLEGQILEGLWEKLTVENKRTLIEELGKLIKEVHSLGVSGLESIDCHWNQFIERQLNQCVERHRRNGISESLIEELPRYLRDAAGLIPRSIKPVLLTGEYTPMNLLVREGSDGWHIEGLIDFGDCMLGFHEYDLLGLEPFLFKAIMPF